MVDAGDILWNRILETFLVQNQLLCNFLVHFVTHLQIEIAYFERCFLFHCRLRVEHDSLLQIEKDQMDFAEDFGAK